MKRIILAVSAVVITALGLIGVTTETANATTTESCVTINIPGHVDDQSCMRINWTRISATRLTLNWVYINCNHPGFYNSNPALDGHTLEVRADTGAIAWNTSDANADVSTSCERTWDFADRTINTRYLTGFYQATARVNNAVDVDYHIWDYTPSS